MNKLKVKVTRREGTLEPQPNPSPMEQKTVLSTRVETQTSYCRPNELSRVLSGTQNQVIFQREFNVKDG